MWCDAVVVLLHNCTDGTAEVVKTVIPESEAGRVVARSDHAPEWQEMRLRQDMLEIARGLGASHMALIDDDEILTGNLLGTIQGLVQGIAAGQILQLPWLCLRQNGLSENMAETGVMVSGMWATQNASTAFLDNPAFHWAARDGYDLHHRHPMGLPYDPRPVVEDRSGGLMHLQFVSRRRLLAKQFLYQLVEQQRWSGRRSASEVRDMYVRTVRESEAARLAPVHESWWAPYAGLMQYLDIDAEPWQESECKRMLAENPGLASGLEDFGLMKEWGV